MQNPQSESNIEIMLNTLLSMINKVGGEVEVTHRVIRESFAGLEKSLGIIADKLLSQRSGVPTHQVAWIILAITTSQLLFILVVLYGLNTFDVLKPMIDAAIK